MTFKVQNVQHSLREFEIFDFDKIFQGSEIHSLLLFPFMHSI